MKNIILFLLLPLFAFGQTEITNDSTYLNWEAGAWYRVTVLTYDNGNSDIFKRFIGDTATLYNQAVDGIRNAVSAMATDVATTSQYRKRVTTLLRESDEILLKAGRSPVDSIENNDAAPFLDAGWTIRRPDGTTIAVTFNKTAQGKLRWNTGTNNQCDLIGNVIRLRNYPTNGSNMDFYRTPNGKRWTSLDGQTRLVPPNGNAGNR